MSLVKIFNKPSATEKPKLEKCLEKFTDIKQALALIGIDFERWNIVPGIDAKSSQQEVLKAYSKEITEIQKTFNFKSVDVINMNPEAQNIRELRQKFLAEHIHDDDEIRYFISGQGLFTVHAEKQNAVYMILCQAGDFIRVPASTKHWFDMGEEINQRPNFKCIRFFSDEAGWVAKYTNDNIAAAYPLIDNFTQTKYKAIVTDIEGTTSSISFVHDVLFPYATKNIPTYLKENYAEEKIFSLIEEALLKSFTKEDLASLSDEQKINKASQQFLAWIKEDKKIKILKDLQGLVWEAGYRQGDFKGHIYQDAYLMLLQFYENNIPLYVYSSGSVYAQKLLFAHTDYGDLNYIFAGNFDTKIGAKKEAASYKKIHNEISKDFSCAAAEILFLSDMPAEISAAKEAGFSTYLVSRAKPELRNLQKTGEIPDFFDIELLSA